MRGTPSFRCRAALERKGSTWIKVTSVMVIVALWTLSGRHTSRKYRDSNETKAALVQGPDRQGRAGKMTVAAAGCPGPRRGDARLLPLSGSASASVGPSLPPPHCPPHGQPRPSHLPPDCGHPRGTTGPPTRVPGPLQLLALRTSLYHGRRSGAWMVNDGGWTDGRTDDGRMDGCWVGDAGWLVNAWNSLPAQLAFSKC